MKTEDSDSLKDKKLQNHRIQRILEFWEKYPSGNAAWSLRKQLGVHSQREWARLLTASRDAIKSRKRDFVRPHHQQRVSDLIASDPTLTASQITTILHEEDNFKEMPRSVVYLVARSRLMAKWRQSLTREQRAAIKEHVRTSPHRDPLILCDELQQRMDLPRALLHRLVNQALIALTTQQLTVKQARRQIVKYMLHSEDWDNVVKISDDLQNSFPYLSRKVLHQLVTAQFKTMARRSLPVEHREEVKKYVLEHEDMSTATLCANLQTTFSHLGFSPRAWPPIVANFRGQKKQLSQSRSLTPQQRRLILQYIESSPHVHDRDVLYDELESKFGLPRHKLYRLVKRVTSRMEGRRVARTLRERVQTFVERTSAPFNVPQMYEKLKTQERAVEPHVLYDLLRSAVSSAESKKHISEELLQIVKSHVEQSPHLEDIPRLADEIRAQHALKISPRTLNTLVRRISNQIFRQRFTKEDKEQLRRFVENSPDKDAAQLTEELQGMFPDFPSSFLNVLVHQDLTRMRRKAQKM